MLKLSAFIIAFSVFMGLVFGMNLLVLPRILAEKHPVILPIRMYTAEYENVCSDDQRGPERRLISCNGKGLFIYEWNKLRFLYDAHKQLEYIIDPSNRNLYIHRFKQTGAEWLDEEMFLKSPDESFGFKQICEKQMFGHKCRVYIYELNPGSVITCFDENAKVLVYREIGGPGRTCITKLLKYSPQALTPNEFVLPKDYRVIDCTK